MTKIVNWLKKNKLLVLIILFLLFLVAKDYLPRWRASLPISQVAKEKSVTVGEVGLTPSMDQSGLSLLPPPTNEYAPTETENRLVVTESTLSLVVNDVRKTSDQIIAQAKSLNGYMVNTTLTNPEEAPFATVTVRVPSENLRDALDYFRSLAIKVTSENIQGTDVTDEYVDVEARIATLEKTKSKFEEILDKATVIQDLLNVQRQLVYIQDQIDSLKGRQKYLEQTAKLAKITVYLSTDEYALPYAPTEAFRPKVIFKLAVRSLVNTLRSFAKALIWLGVYAVIWVPLGAIIFFVWRRLKKK
jgi:hypothetical protein